MNILCQLVHSFFLFLFLDAPPLPKMQKITKKYLRVCKYNASLGDIFNGEFCFSSLARDSSDGSGQVISLQRFNCQNKSCQMSQTLT